MDWLSLRSGLQGPAVFTSVPTEVTDLKVSTKHVEHVEHIEHIQHTELVHELDSKSRIPFSDSSLSDHVLPFISAGVVRDQRNRLLQGQGRAWIVVDNIVYDCTDFVQDHPGGDTVIRSFVGEDCTWQFWRFHSKETMEQWGRALRVGRTEGVENRFSEPPRFFGLRGSHKLR